MRSYMFKFGMLLFYLYTLSYVYCLFCTERYVPAQRNAFLPANNIPTYGIVSAVGLFQLKDLWSV